MGITIDEAIQNIEIVKEDYWEDDGYGNETKAYEDTMLSFDMLIDIAKKYQKIEQICAKYGFKAELFEEIKEVIEDGSN